MLPIEELCVKLEKYFNEHSVIFIYGRGDNSKKLMRYIAERGLLSKVKGFCVSDHPYSSWNEMDNQIFQTYDAFKVMPSLPDGAGVVLAVDEKHQREIMETFPDYTDWLRISDNEWKNTYFSGSLAYTMNRQFKMVEIPLSTDFADMSWFVQFFRHHFPESKSKINFYGTRGTRDSIKEETDAYKVFVSMEALSEMHDNPWQCAHRKQYPEFHDHCLDDADLSIGFEYVQAENYLRIPCWVFMYMSPFWGEKEIAQWIEKINKSHYKKSRECALIASHDMWGTRSMIVNKTERFMDITFAGRWRNNTSELWNKFNNDKVKFLKKFKFNICAENFNNDDCCSEKIFDAFLADTVPLYYGSNNKPEPNVINPDRVIFFHPTEDDRPAMKLLQDLIKDENLYYEFAAQDKFMPNAAEYIYEMYYCKLRDKLKLLA